MTDNNLDNNNVENSKAPLVSHLIELRDRLKWAVIAFFIAFLVCYFCYSSFTSFQPAS